MVILIGCLFRSMLESPSRHSNLSTSFSIYGSKIVTLYIVWNNQENYWIFDHLKSCKWFEGAWFNFLLYSKGPALILKKSPIDWFYHSLFHSHTIQDSKQKSVILFATLQKRMAFLEQQRFCKISQISILFPRSCYYYT